jgi:hypothetical protein
LTNRDLAGRFPVGKPVDLDDLRTPPDDNCESGAPSPALHVVSLSHRHTAVGMPV